MHPTSAPDPRRTLSSSWPSRKRTVQATTTTCTSDTPSILHRPHHRRRNIAIETWGLDDAGPSTAVASSTRTTNGTTTARFNIYKALVRHPTLFPAFLLALPLESAIALYSIDKELHYLFNLYSLSLIHLYAHTHFPVASRVFSAALHPDLCISDPMLRPMDGREWLARDVPGWRWVGMVRWRERVVRGVLGRLGLGGGVGWLGRAVEESVYKFWSLMDMPSTSVRAAYLADRDIWTDTNILSFQLFLVKLDMRFSHPVTGNGSCGLAHLLCTYSSLAPLWYVLSGRIRLDYDKAEELVRRTYLNEDLDLETYGWLDDEDDIGVPERWWGIMMKEGRETHGERMESAVDMVIEEGVKRELHVHQQLLDLVLDGHVDWDGENLIRVKSRWNESAADMQGWPSSGKRDLAIASLDNLFELVKSSEENDGDAMDVST